MKKRIKKVGCIFLSAVILLIFSVHSSAQEAMVYASHSVSTWHSDDAIIGYWDRPIRVYCEGMSQNGLRTANLQSYATGGFSLWQSHLGISVSQVSSWSASNVVLRAVDTTTASNLGVDPGVGHGYTRLLFDDDDSTEDNMTAVDIVSYRGTPKYVYEIYGSVVIYLISNGVFTSTDFWQPIAFHEISHALGYYGHCFHQAHLMNATIADYGVETLSNGGSGTDTEVPHLKQIYDYYT